MGLGPIRGQEVNGEYKHVMFECWEHWKESKSWPDMMMSVAACDAIMCPSLSVFWLIVKTIMRCLIMQK